MNRSTLYLLGALGAMALGACTSAPADCPTPPPTETKTTEAKDASSEREEQAPARDEGLGTISEAFARGLGEFEDAREVTVEMGPEGQVRKLVLAHGDASKIPAAVLELTEATFPESTIVAYEWEYYLDGGEAHEIEVKNAEGIACEVSAKPDGSLRYKECEIPTSEIPEAMQAKIEEMIPGAEILEAETKEGPAEGYTSIKVKKDGQVHYLRFDTDGTFRERARRLPSVVKVYE